MTEASPEEREVMIHNLYGVWLARKETGEGKRIAAPHVVVTSVTSFMEEWRSV